MATRLQCTLPRKWSCRHFFVEPLHSRYLGRFALCLGTSEWMFGCWTWEPERAMNSSGQHDEDKLDETLDETFPASDAPGNTVEMGIRTGDVSPTLPLHVTDNQELKR